MFVVFATWYLNFAGIIYRFESVLNVFFADEGGTSTLDSYTSTVSRTSPELIDILRIATFKYGKSLVLFIFAGLFVATVVLQYLRNRRTTEMNIYVTVFAVCFGGFASGSLLFLVFDLIVGWGRPLMFANIFGLVLAGLFFYTLWSQLDSESRSTISDASYRGFVTVLVVLAVFTVYPSPYGSNMNPQVTEMEYEGTEWLFDHRVDNYQAEEFGISQRRFFEAQNGEQPLPDGIRREETLPPEHFNYTLYPTVGQSYTDNTYLLLTELGRITYPAKFPGYRQSWSFTPEDFNRVERDPTVTQFYDNGEFDAYFISGSRGPAGGVGTTANQTATTAAQADVVSADGTLK
jgi:hypothetical protein